DADVERETGRARDADEAIAGLDGERADVTAAREGEEAAGSTAAAARTQAAGAVADLEREVDALSAHLAAEEARRAALGREIDERAERAERLRARAAEVDDALAGLGDGGEHAAALDAAAAAVAAANDDSEARRAGVVEAERGRAAAQAAEAAARDALQAAETAHAALCAEQAALADLNGGDGGAWPALIDEVNVEAGMETALGAALGDDLAASNDADAPMHWRRLDPDPAAPPLPKGAKPLSDSVTGPPALARRLAQVGVVAAADGPRLQRALAQGQRLVSRDGALWRWDGLTVAADAATPAATRLRQRNRLKALGGEIADSEARRAAAMKQLAAARAGCERSGGEERDARAALARANEAAAAARDARADAAAAAASASSRLSDLTDSAERLAAELKQAEERRAAALAARDAPAPDDEGRARLDSLRASLTERRGELAECESIHARVRREAEARRDRLAAITAELESWGRRAAGAAERLAQLAERRAAAAAELDALGGRPAEIAAQREALLDNAQAAQAERKRAADAVAEAETLLADRDRRLKESDAALAEAREHRVRGESARAQAAGHRDEVDRAIAERLGCAPAELAAVAGLDGEGAEWPAEEEIETRLARLIRERDNMGAVNLRAEAEAAEIEEQHGVLAGERVDLEAAIARLRQAIARLNREGRERVESAFDKIDGHFGALFTRLFAGGRAHLSLVDSDDPLEAGLEVMASPPGKRLQSLSLLSGGEQALTALALLFAVFLTNPTPICVLDEVDAPLDDANVARFCDLLQDIARGSSTRFLIVTHHRMTMARMDRLFGVTMAERGVSQLVSVDLRAAEELRAAD
ncbi:MAG: chromosome partitioning protein ParA, partial [Proteobacteria bacterium]|nr:chromosome partitioning protein ParA [Pseudomonadota bacterium]